MADTQSSLIDQIQFVLASEIEKVIEEEAKLAAQRVEKRVKERAAVIASSVLRYFDMESFRDRLVITVRFTEGKS